MSAAAASLKALDDNRNLATPEAVLAVLHAIPEIIALIETAELYAEVVDMPLMTKALAALDEALPR